MDRRDVLAALGAGAFGLVAANSARADDDSGHDHGHEAGQLLAKSPLSQIHLYLCAFHVAKKDPSLVFEAHHYCMPVGDEVHQCVIFDSNGKNAKILGIEYIISDKLYRGLPDGEKKYYHPHTYEITSGLLVAPDMDALKEDKLMEGLLTTWGKTWHTWPDPKTALPMGDPLLMWAFTKDGQMPADMLAQRDKEMNISTPEIRKRRTHIGPVPQIDSPKSLDQIGRQWTNEGPDVPTR